MIKRSYRPRISICCDTGDVRKDNQDRIVAIERMVGSSSVALLAVADGCGGMSHGEVVSQLIAESLKRFFDEELPEMLSQRRLDIDAVRSALEEWLVQVNASARAFGKQMGESVGSTLALLLLLDNRYLIVSAGDSRIYLLRSGRISQLTEDQSKVSDMVRNHEITPEQAKTYPGKNVLTMCIGFYEKLRLYAASGTIRKNDVFLLCSDGFYGVMEDELSAIIPAGVEYASARTLRNLIPEGAAQDNVSILLAQMIPVLIGV